MSEELNRYKKLVPFLGETLGSVFEVTLYDLRDPAYPILASANTREGDQENLRAFVMEAAESRNVQEKGYYANRMVATDAARMLKASAFFLYDKDGKAIGALCLSLRCDFFLKMSSFAGSFLNFNMEDLESELPEDFEGAVPERKEPAPPREISLDTITEYIQDYSVEPSRISQDERMEIILDLYDMGVYGLKGAVARTALELQVSEQSIYRYLTKIKRAREW